MVIELAEINVAAGDEAAFEAAIATAKPLFDAAAGCRGMALHRSIEVGQRYWLLVRWDTLEDHVIGFRQSPAFAEWRALAGPYFAQPPRVEHLEAVVGES